MNDQTTTTSTPEWATRPLRDGEYDVPVMFRVTANSAQSAREKVARILARDWIENTTVPMYLAPESETAESVRESVRHALRDAHRNDSAADAVEYVSDVVGWAADEDDELRTCEDGCGLHVDHDGPCRPR